MIRVLWLARMGALRDVQPAERHAREKIGTKVYAEEFRTVRSLTVTFEH